MHHIVYQRPYTWEFRVPTRCYLFPFDNGRCINSATNTSVAVDFHTNTTADTYSRTHNGSQVAHE